MSTPTPAQTDYAKLLGQLPLPLPTPTAEDAPEAAPKRSSRRREERLNTLRQWLLEGVTAAQAEAFAALQWQVSRHTAREYVREVLRVWAADSSRVDYLAQLWLTKLQREHLVDKAMRKLSDCADLKTWMALLRVCHQLLKDRDQLLGRIHQHRVRTRRDASPDSRAARQRRQGQVAFSVEELHERLQHWRNALHQQWQTSHPV